MPYVSANASRLSGVSFSRPAPAVGAGRAIPFDQPTKFVDSRTDQRAHGREKKWSGRPGSNRRRPAWEAGILPLNYARRAADWQGDAQARAIARACQITDRRF